MRRFSWILLTLGLGCATTSTAAPSDSSVAAASAHETTTTDVTANASDAARVVFLVRHAEKASDGTENPPLTEAGQRRATCLARVLGDAGVTHVFATELQRTQQTVTPLATARGLTVKQVPASDNAALVAALDELPAGSVAVVAGHSNTLPAIAAELGAALSGLDADGNIDHATYDRLDVVLRGPTPSRLQLRYCETSG